VDTTLNVVSGTCNKVGQHEAAAAVVLVISQLTQDCKRLQSKL